MAKPMTPFSQNCFTIALHGAPVPGIKLAPAEQGLPTRLTVGHYYLMIDSKVPAQVDCGVTKLATIRQVSCGAGRGIRTLGQPESARPGVSLVRVDCRIPGKKSAVMADGFPVQLYTGVTGGQVIERFEQEYLVELFEGQALTVFFEDGSVRSWRRQGQILEEKHLVTSEDVLAARIKQAKSVLAAADDRSQAQDFIRAILLGIVDLLRFTVLLDKKGEGQGLRLRLLREFFLELPEHQRVVVARSLFAALHAVDPTLLPLIQSESDSLVSATVTDIAVRRAEVAALSPEDRAIERTANIARDQAARAAKQLRQATFKASRQAKAKAAAAPKDGKKKKDNKAA